MNKKLIFNIIKGILYLILILFAFSQLEIEQQKNVCINIISTYLIVLVNGIVHWLASPLMLTNNSVTYAMKKDEEEEKENNNLSPTKIVKKPSPGSDMDESNQNISNIFKEGNLTDHIVLDNTNIHQNEEQQNYIANAYVTSKNVGAVTGATVYFQTGDVKSATGTALVATAANMIAEMSTSPQVKNMWKGRDHNTDDTNNNN